MKIKGKDYVARGFPPTEGKKLADALIRHQQLTWDDLEVDLTGCPPSMLISAFFNGFLQEVYERNAELLPLARVIKWGLEFEFQSENVLRWMNDFKPYDANKFAASTP